MNARPDFFIHTEQMNVHSYVLYEVNFWNKGVPIQSHFNPITIPIHLTNSAATHL